MGGAKGAPHSATAIIACTLLNASSVSDPGSLQVNNLASGGIVLHAESLNVHKACDVHKVLTTLIH